MRHLLNTYVRADDAIDVGNLKSLSLTELIIDSGIHDAIAKKLNAKGTLSRNSIVEGIINNVRKTIIRDQLTDPRFCAKVSKILEDLIAQSRADSRAYEAFLGKAEDLVIQMARKDAGSHPDSLNGNSAAQVLFNNLTDLSGAKFQCPADQEARASLALDLDAAVREHAPSDWRGDDIRETQVLNALFPMMSRDRNATSAIFEIIKKQPGY